MRLSLKGMAIAAGLMWSVGFLFVGLIHLAVPSYANDFLNVVGSVYPFFHGGRSFGDVILGTIDAVIDGAAGGFILAWLYNFFAGNRAAA